MSEPALLGKTRRFDHVEGNWPGFVFIPVPEHIVEQATERCKSRLLPGYRITDDPNNLVTADSVKGGGEPDSKYFLKFNADPTSTDPPHISLSKPLSLRYHEIGPFVEEFAAKLRVYKPFSISLRKFAVYINEDRSKSFLSVDVDSGRDQLTEMIDSVNVVLRKYGLEEFYQLPRPHVSLAWGHGNLQNALPGNQPQPDDVQAEQSLDIADYRSTDDESSSSGDEDDLLALECRVTEIVVKCGSTYQRLGL